jgi:hypothetical protein
MAAAAEAIAALEDATAGELRALNRALEMAGGTFGVFAPAQPPWPWSAANQVPVTVVAFA